MQATKARHRYVAVAILLCIATPLGVLALRYGAAHDPGNTWAFIRATVTADPILYLYLSFGTAVSLMVPAWVAGVQSDRMSLLARRLESMAMRDPITGLYNRAHMDMRLASEISRAARNGRPLSCLLVRMVNPEDRGQGGASADLDPIRCDLSFCLRTTCREFDIIGHESPDTFLVVLPETSLYDAWIVAGRVLTALAKTPFTFRGASIEVAVNIGGAEVDQDVRWMDRLVGVAHAALDRAAEEGVNNIVMHDPVSLRFESKAEPSAPAHT